ncbi:type II toxin-antitoxin system PemK/MazF family toxin [Candidatus Gracilibacteria bacterium]|nr:type II toxin-antitoxin system PemK/MazF family toxin [Candidatus Gracilibacteria bacterium]
MNKDIEIFDNWNEEKKKIHNKKSEIYFKQGDIWRISLGINIKSESNGKGENFRRPVLILKKLSSDSCIVVPLSSKIKIGSWFYQYNLHGIKETALLYQIRMIHKNRFQRKIGELDEKDFSEIKKRLKNLLNL